MIKPENIEVTHCPDHNTGCKKVSNERRGQRNDGRIPNISKIFTNTSIISIITVMSRDIKWWSRKELKEYNGEENQTGVILELTKEAITQYIDFLAGIGILDEISGIIKKASKALGIDKNTDFNDYYYRYVNKDRHETDNFENLIAKEICSFIAKSNKEWTSKDELIRHIFTDCKEPLIPDVEKPNYSYSCKETRKTFNETISHLISKKVIEKKTFRELIEKESNYKMPDKINNEKFYAYNEKMFNKIRGELLYFAKKMNSEYHSTKTKEKMMEEAQLDLFLKNTQDLTSTYDACITPANGIGMTLYLHKDRPTTLGRNKYADIFVGDLNVSRTSNTEIIFKNGEYIILNGKKNPITKVNDYPSPEQKVLNNGDKITIGNEMFYFVKITINEKNPLLI